MDEGLTRTGDYFSSQISALSRAVVGRWRKACVGNSDLVLRTLYLVLLAAQRCGDFHIS